MVSVRVLAKSIGQFGFQFRPKTKIVVLLVHYSQLFSLVSELHQRLCNGDINGESNDFDRLTFNGKGVQIHGFFKFPRLMCGSCHFDRASNDEFSVKFWMFVLIFFQPTFKSDLKEVYFTQNDLFWVKAPLKVPQILKLSRI